MARVESGVAGDESWPAALRWACAYLPEYFSEAPCRFHCELMCVLEDARLRLVARIAPRGHAKSTCAAFAYPLWCICQQQRRNIVVVTHESELARQFVRDIRTELESNERILAKYGDLCRAEEGEEGTKGRNPNRRRRGRWSDVQFTTVTGITVQAKGAGAAFRGLRVGPHRPDLIICDDLEKDKHIESAAMRRKLENWLRRVVMPALSPDGKLLVLGSLLHYDSLLANLRDRQRFPRWDYAVYRALEAEPGPDGQYQRVALWPARWPVERLDEERERIGSVAFEQEYQANPIDETRRAFCPEWLQRYEPQELVPERLVNVMAVDPATGSSGGDYFALWVGSVDSESGVIYTRQLTLERIGVVAQVKRIVAAFQRWRPVVVGIETVGYQKALLQAVEEESRRRKLYMPLVGIRPAGSKVARIESSAILYADGRFRLPPVLDPECEQQFLHFPKAAHDDAPDVCAMGIELVRGLHLGAAAEGAVAPWDAHDRRGGW